MCDYTKKPEKWDVFKCFEGSVYMSRKAFERVVRKLFKQLADDDLDLAYQLQTFLNYGTIENGTLYELQSYFHRKQVQANRLAKISPAYLHNEILDPFVNDDPKPDLYFP